MLPRGVRRVLSRGHEYYYFQAGRGTPNAGKRIALPPDPQSPEFWQAIRAAQGLANVVPTDTVNALIDAYLTSPAYLTKISEGTQYQYKRSLDIARKAWGPLRTAGLRPVHIQKVMDELSDRPAGANSFLSAMRTLSGWARSRDMISSSLVEGVKPYPAADGHKPWTPAQIACAHKNLTGAVRRGVLLALYTGQRGSDVVRLGPTDIEDAGFRLRQRKTGREVWCPIVPELAAEMATWPRVPGPFLRQANGKPYDRKLLWLHFDAERAKHQELAGAMLHGLRATAVVRLRQAGLSVGQIGDIVGMSLAMIQRYCRFADKKASGQAALISLKNAQGTGLENIGKLENKNPVFSTT